MSITCRIIDSDGSRIDSVINRGRRGLLVATMPSREMQFYDALFTDTTGSAEMVIDASSGGGATLNVWNGTGAGDVGADWTLTDNYGGSSESPAAAHSGTNGVDTGLMSAGDAINLDNGVAINLGVYDIVSFWVNTVSRGPASELTVSWLDGGGALVGNAVLTSSYTAWTIGTWVLVQIPLVDFMLTGTVQSLNILASGQKQQHYMDDFTLSASGGGAVGPTVFRVAPPGRYEIEVHKILLTIAAPSAGWDQDAFANISGGLAAGVILRMWDYYSGEVVFSQVAKENIDLYSRMTQETYASFFDTDVLVTLVYDTNGAPIRLHGNYVLDIVIQDDLSSLPRMQARVQGAIGIYQPDLDGELPLNDEG